MKLYEQLISESKMQIIDKIKQLALADKHSCITWRRHLHTNPELSFKEEQTSKYVRQVLVSNGFTEIETIGDTGVFVTINGKGQGKTIMLRADMDALPIHENNVLAYQSIVPGVMHACGHDGHTAMLLLASKILAEIKDELKGTVKILFQPAEELIPGGALKMIDAGILNNPNVDAAIGQHVMPGLPSGKVGIKAGRFMASSDNFKISIRGKGGHAAMPENLVDPVLIAGHIIVALQQIVSRNRSPKIPTVLSIGKVSADGSSNVIPDEVIMEGTFRTLDNEWREDALIRIEKLAKQLAEGMGAACIVEITRGYPPLQNDHSLIASLKTFMIEYVGA
ncbi:MAG: amidohydrolase, partial [Marivirga sp.]|nr:amidohydrolase [Marivirga sp.]